MFDDLRKIFKKIRPTIGIDLGSTSIKTVEVKGNLHNLQLVGVHKVDSPPDAVLDGEITNKELVVKKINSLVNMFTWQGKQVVTGVGGRKVMIRHLKMPVMPEGELRKAIQYELASYLPFGNQEVVIDYVNLGTITTENYKQCLILMAAIPKELALDYYTVFSAAGLDLVAIDIIPLALQRSLAFQEKSGAIAFADIGSETTTFFILAGGKVSLARSIATGSSVVNQELLMFKEQIAATGESPSGKVLFNNMENDHELVRELRRSFDFWRTQSQNNDISKLVVTGGIGNLEEVDSFLSSQLGISVEVGQPLAGLLKDEKRIGPEYAVAAGLALRGVTK